MQGVCFVLSDPAQKHIQALLDYYISSNGRIDIKTYLQRLLKVIQTIDQYYNISSNFNEYKYLPLNRSPFGKTSHKQKYSGKSPKENGFLNPPLDNCISRNIDMSNRLVAFEIDKGIIGIVSVLGHYNKNIFNNIDFQDIVSNMKRIYKTTPEQFNLQCIKSKTLLDSFSEIINTNDVPNNYKKFNRICNEPIFPLEFYGLHDYFDKQRQSILDSKNSTDYEIKNKKDKLEHLDYEIYKILRNTIDFSYFTSIVLTDNRYEQLNKIIPVNQQLMQRYTDNNIFLYKNKNVFNNPILVVDKALQACSSALANSFNFTVDDNLLNDFALKFKNEVDYDISIIQGIKNKKTSNKLTEDDFTLKNTTIFLEEYHEQITKRNLNSNDSQLITNTLTEDKSHFAIPFKDRDIAKQNGAKWDFDVSCWYVPSGIDLSPFTAQGWRKLTDKEVNEAREQKRAINAKNSSMTDQQRQNIRNSNEQDNVQKIDNCIEIPFSISPKDFQGVEALGAFFDKEKEKWFVPKDPKTIKAVGKYLSEEETAKRRVNEAIACQKRKKEEKLNQQDQKKNKKNKGR